ncbi:MAG: flagellar biosynthesis anti-sigma factor FlgM [Novosphingobium sp.]|nr:flagellar biosynthesis anti-sigma factor FlgM [Novosphingobium sp.]MBX9644836.1 flagellar biosynthesis anti-sigma factor FlgM [Novosphingobium sp.]
MPPVELGPLGPQTPRGPGLVAKGKPTGPVASDSARSQAAPQSAVQRSAALDPGQPPVNSERVAEISKAIERGLYPVLPMKVADAMIAAGLLLRSGK